MLYLFRSALLLALTLGSVWSIQLWDSPDELPDSFPQACRAALSQNITCSQLVPGNKAASQALYGNAELTDLCTSVCLDSLVNFQKSVHDGCGDRILEYNGTSTTGSQLADPLAWAYNVTCLPDGNELCNPLLFNSSSAVDGCSNCLLGYISKMLESPYGRYRFSDESFSRRLSSCGVPATKFSYTTPSSTVTATGTRSSISSSPTPTGRVCTGDSYTVAEEDTCPSIAQAHSIPLGNFLADNGIDQNCTTLRPGSEVCLAPPCTLHVVEQGDTCKSIIAGRGFYLTQLLSWNPTIHRNCDNLSKMIGLGICVSPPGSTEWDVVTSNRTSSMTSTMFTGWETGPAPVQIISEPSYPAIPTTFNTPTSTVTLNMTEQSIIADYMRYCPLTLGSHWEDLAEDCQDLLEPYCESDPDRPAPTSTVFPRSCTPSSVSASPTPTSSPSSSIASTGSASPTASRPSPTMPGNASNCDKYHKIVENDGCYDLAHYYGVSLEDFYSWNPGVGDNCQALKRDYYVCVGISASASSTASPSTTTTSTGSTPSPTLDDPSCKKYHKVVNGDGCYDLAHANNISVEDFYSWNPGVGDYCRTLKLDYYVCVGE